MKYCCDKMIQLLSSGDDKTTIRLQQSLDLSNEWLFTVIYRDRKKKNPRQFGWGFKGMRYCPSCGEKLK